jgi:hypothetical protein
MNAAIDPSYVGREGLGGRGERAAQSGERRGLPRGGKFLTCPCPRFSPWRQVFNLSVAQVRNPQVKNSRPQERGGIRKLKTRGHKKEAGIRKLKTRGHKKEAGIRKLKTRGHKKEAESASCKLAATRKRRNPQVTNSRPQEKGGIRTFNPSYALRDDFLDSLAYF